MILKLQNISFSFSPEKPLFKNLCFALEQGKIYALMGANGAGKTTLFNLITGFHKPASGIINFQQQTTTGLAPYKINRMGIGRTFQDLRLIAKLTVKENILLAMPGDPTDNWTNALLPGLVFKKQMQQMERKAEKIIADYFLQDVQQAMADEISFGQQKLLNLACCVANQAQLLLLDEPVAGISPQYREQITALIKQLKQQGKTLLMIEHNTDFIAETADRFLFLSDGALSEFDNFEQLQTSPQAADAYF
ncbi:ATP-binding cassette domain-containing protein [Methylobacter sp. Wu8]|uniref:ABC transporter ATP-binding protein n=1 Tax=Methylobacter sp. Wu8 TaxID=3118457 RepID=UPI002F2C0F96